MALSAKACESCDENFELTPPEEAAFERAEEWLDEIVGLDEDDPDFEDDNPNAVCVDEAAEAIRKALFLEESDRLPTDDGYDETEFVPVEEEAINDCGNFDPAVDKQDRAQEKVLRALIAQRLKECIEKAEEAERAEWEREEMEYNGSPEGQEDNALNVASYERYLQNNDATTPRNPLEQQIAS